VGVLPHLNPKSAASAPARPRRHTSARPRSVPLWARVMGWRCHGRLYGDSGSTVSGGVSLAVYAADPTMRVKFRVPA